MNKAINLFGQGMKKGFEPIFAVIILTLMIVWGLFSFYLNKTPFMGRLDAAVGCPFYNILGGLFAGLFGCGFMSIFHVIMFLTFISVIIMALWGK